MVDFSLDESKVVKMSDVDLLLQQIDMLFDTTPGEVLGQSEFGTRYDKFLYNLSITNEGLKSQIEYDLSRINLMGFSANVEVYLYEGTENDIALIQIDLVRGDETYNKVYRMS